MKKNYLENMAEIEELTKNSKNMLLVTDRGIKVESDKVNLLSMLAMTLKHLRQTGSIDDDELDRVVEIARMSDKEIQADTMRMIKENLEKLKEALDNE